MIIAGVQDLRDELGHVLFLDRLGIVPLVEGLEAEFLHRLGIPDPQRVNKAVSVSDDRHVVGHRLDGLVALLTVHGAAALDLVARDISAEVDLLRILGPLDLERIAVPEPIVRHLHLIPVHNFLPEHAVVIADAAAVCRVVQRRQRIEEAGGKAPEAAVAQRGIRLLVLDGIDVKAQLLQRLGDRLVCHQIDGVVAERAAHQELHGEIDDFLRILLPERLLRLHPAVDDLIAERHGRRLEHLLLCRILDFSPVHGPDVVLHAATE